MRAWRACEGHPSGQTPSPPCPQHSKPVTLLCAPVLSTAALHACLAPSHPPGRRSLARRRTLHDHSRKIFSHQSLSPTALFISSRTCRYNLKKLSFPCLFACLTSVCSIGFVFLQAGVLRGSQLPSLNRLPTRV